jgi:uncharacterized protein (TIGR02594 family)
MSIFRPHTLKQLTPEDNPMPIAVPPWLENARDDLGVAEVPGKPAHPRIIKMHSYTTLKATSDEVPWCSSAMCAWMEESGIRSTRNAAARSWFAWGRKLSAPVYGAVCVMWRGGSRDPNVAGPGHVGIYVGPGTRPGTVRILGGNQGNSVKLSDYPAADVFGYRWPTEYPLP